MKRFRRLAKRSLALSRVIGVSASSRLLARDIFQGDTPAAAEKVRLLNYPAGLWIRPHGSDLDVLLQIFAERDYDLSWDGPYQTHLKETSERIQAEGNIPVIIDAGANIGASTLWFLLNFPECHVFAIEPDRGNFDMLSRNVGDRANITLVHAGLWDRAAELSLVEEGDDSWGRRVDDTPKTGPSIASVTIPALLARDPRFRPLIVKIDIEGAETAVFRSNTEWVDDVPLLIFEPHDNHWGWLGTWQSTAHAFFSALTRRKREYLFRGENILAFLHPDSAA